MTTTLIWICISIAFIFACFVVLRKLHTNKQQNDKDVPHIKFSQIQYLMDLEIERARRLNHKLSLIVIKENTPKASNNILKQIDPADRLHTEQNIVNIENALLLRQKLRMVDTISLDDKKEMIVLLQPGLDSDQCIQSMLRVKTLLGIEKNHQIHIGTAVFPDDGLILDDLISIASTNKVRDDAINKDIHKEFKSIKIQHNN